MTILAFSTLRISSHNLGLALVRECSIPLVWNVALQPFSSYRVSWRS